MFICVKVNEKWFYSENVPSRSNKKKESGLLGLRNCLFKSVQIIVVNEEATLIDYKSSHCRFDSCYAAAGKVL